MQQVRRVITGEDSAGKSFIVGIDQIAAIKTAGIDLFPIWGIPAIPVPLPATGMETAGNAAGAGVVRTAIGILPARALVRSDDAGHLQFDADGFHRTDSVDIACVIRGSVTMRVPGEPDTLLNVGDCIVQNGALHAWHNDGDEDAAILWVWIKGKRAVEAPASG